jgi:hypothetical protein
VNFLSASDEANVLAYPGHRQRQNSQNPDTVFPSPKGRLQSQKIDDNDHWDPRLWLDGLKVPIPLKDLLRSSPQYNDLMEKYLAFRKSDKDNSDHDNLVSAIDSDTDSGLDDFSEGENTNRNSSQQNRHYKTKSPPKPVPRQNPPRLGRENKPKRFSSANINREAILHSWWELGRLYRKFKKMSPSEF